MRGFSLKVGFLQRGSMFNKERQEIVIYRGRSMSPTLKHGDVLHILPYKGKGVRCGDVVVFIPQGKRNKVVHRVISMDSSGIRTKGDNNPCADSIPLSPHDIIGRVVSVQRGKKRIRIYGGRIGQVVLIIKRITIGLDRAISRLFHYPYHWLTQLGVFRVFLPPSLKPRIIRFRGPSGDDLRIVMGRRVIGRFIPQKGQWQIKRPFRVFISDDTIKGGN